MGRVASKYLIAAQLKKELEEINEELREIRFRNDTIILVKDSLEHGTNSLQVEPRIKTNGRDRQ